MKKLILGLAVAMVATFAQASYLYWQVDNSGLKEGSFNGHTITGYQLVGNGNVMAMTYLQDDDTWTTETAASVSPQVAQAGVYSNLSSTEYTYYIEVLGYDKAAYGEGNIGVIAVSQGASYSDLVANGSVAPDLSSLAQAALAWNGGPSYAAPEPTSGLLLLLGGALLALKRRRA